MWCRCTVALTVLVDVVVTGPVLPRRVGTGFVCTLLFVILGFCQTLAMTVVVVVGGWFVFS